MFKRMSIRKRVAVMLLIFYALSIVATAAVGWLFMRAESDEISEDKTNLFSAVMEANREYMVKVLRPKSLKMLPDAYFPEASVGIVMLSEIGSIIQEKHPEFIYKIASENPLDLHNAADIFERETLDYFRETGVSEWRGRMGRDGKEFYAIASPMKAKPGCMKCHSTPDVAPPEMVAQYGKKSGYNYKLEEIVGGTFVYLPAAVSFNRAMNKLLIFMAWFSAFYFLVIFIVDRIILFSVVQPVESLAATAESLSMGDLDVVFEVKTEDEMKVLAGAFTRIKVSMRKAMDLLGEGE
ncbi:DUF3365 domain-containing protein [Myxococcota bacterium]|nr:DUF3365 domain-containing protein [Myxococcota bacterium]MBU1897730.1 DUF3365 domain-containing protein [Myxococcota bacterium]